MMMGPLHQHMMSFRCYRFHLQSMPRLSLLSQLSEMEVEKVHCVEICTPVHKSIDSLGRNDNND